ncbi:MAG: class I SAM-dependent methyltransferase [Pyrinomonadaceae bacterium]|nr:class I SAM-dependent methyltransferase [Pyrinomonadaceae bacterium]
MQNLSITKNKKSKDKTQTFYDRIADVHNLAMKVNGYRDSAAKYFRSLKLDVRPDSLVLDAGCGTGLATLAFYSAGYRPLETFALDLSFKSLEVAKEQFERDKISAVKNVQTLQGNLLSMPFEDGKFDIVLTCGALEYVPLDQGINELARVLKKDGILVLIPVRQSLVGSMLEVLYNFKIHSIEEVKKAAAHHFKMVGNHKFPITEPIGWSKTSFLLQKK